MDPNDNSLGIRFIRGCLFAAEWLAPPLFTYLAGRLFFRPQRPPLRAEDATFLDGLERLNTPAGLCAWTAPAPQPNGKRVVLLHGWSMRAAHLIPWVELVHAQGYEAVLVDLPAHGAAAGTITHPPDTEKRLHPFLTELDKIAPIAGFLGHSYGGVMALRASYSILQPQFIIGVAIPNHYIYPEFANYLRLSERGRRRFLEYGKTVTGCDLREFTALNVPPNYATQVYLLHAENDAVVTTEHDERYKAVLPQSEIRQIGQAGHIRAIWDSEVMDAISNILATV